VELRGRWKDRGGYKIGSSLNVYLSHINLIYTSVYLRQSKPLYTFSQRKKTTKESRVNNIRHYYTDELNKLHQYIALQH
jgi:hypothetical protein